MTFLALLVTTFLPLLQVSGTGWASAEPEPSSLTPGNVDAPPANNEGSAETCPVVLSCASLASVELLENENLAFARERCPWSVIKWGEKITEHGI